MYLLICSYSSYLYYETVRRDSRPNRVALRLFGIAKLVAAALVGAALVGVSVCGCGSSGTAPSFRLSVSSNRFVRKPFVKRLV